MKIKIIKGEKDILLVSYEKEELSVKPIKNTRFNTLSIDLPEGCEGFTFLNTLQKITKEQLAYLVKDLWISGFGYYFYDYNDTGENPVTRFRFKNLKDSFKTLLESNGVLFENHLEMYYETMSDEEEFLLDYNKAEQNTFIPAETLVFVKD